MKPDPLRVLFVCTGNSARSIIAEALLGQQDPTRYRACSAGSMPVGQVHPLALEVLRHHGYDTGGLRSKSWDEFAGPQSPALDLVLTVCDRAAGEPCPVWPGQPVTAHWGLPDPAATTGSADTKLRAFAQTLDTLSGWIRDLVELPAEDLDPAALRERLTAIGSRTGTAS